jgi:hypothetical protein
MAINPFFGDFKNEQSLLDELTIETIKATGRDVYYIPREYVKLDKMFGEDILSKFSYGHVIEMYVQDVFKFAGQRDVINKFGIDITDRVTLSVSITRFKQEVYNRNPDIKKPREGDLIYFPLSKSLFEINFVEDELPFYQLGSLTTYTLTCELFTYSNETMETGITEVDEVETMRKMYLTKITLGNSTKVYNTFLGGDIVYQVGGVTGGTFSAASYTATVVDFSNGATDYLYVSDETGTLLFGAATQTILNKAGTVGYYTISEEETTINTSKDPHTEESAGDNKDFDVQKNNTDLFDFTETDPFSSGNY